MLPLKDWQFLATIKMYKKCTHEWRKL